MRFPLFLLLRHLYIYIYIYINDITGKLENAEYLTTK